MKNIIFLVILITAISVTSIFYPKLIRAVPPTLVKDTLSSSQLSYFARLGTGVSSGDSLIRVALSGNPTNDTNNLFIGDTIGIGTSSGPLTIYTIKDIGNTALFQINSSIGQSNAFAGAAIIATHSAIHTISFTPQSNFTAGFWEFLIKATDTVGEVINDGIPDSHGFDLGATTPTSTANGLGTRLKITDVTCPNWGIGTTTAYSIGTTTIPIGIGSSGLYHVVTCYLGVGGTNQIGVGYSMAIGQDLSSGSQLINPSPKDSVEGSADVYTFFVRHRDSTNVLFDGDTIQGKIAMIEAVRVSATVDPTLTFTIDATGVGSAQTACGITFGAAAANTTATQVAFGSVALGTSNDLAQRLSCVTNSDNGYIVTVYEDGNMKNISSATTIPDTTCGGSGCTTSGVGTSWTSFSASGWGYTVQNVSVGTTIFSYGNYRPFGNGAANAQQIMKNISTPTATEQAYVCYRLTASTTQEAGNYENRLIYTATATF
ncbi:MAG: hypothetical protein WC069_00035 [Candidatus Shapirobacteria bacterium]